MTSSTAQKIGIASVATSAVGPTLHESLSSLSSAFEQAVGSCGALPAAPARPRCGRACPGAEADTAFIRNPARRHVASEVGSRSVGARYALAPRH
jgi:hypothetical protein